MFIKKINNILHILLNYFFFLGKAEKKLSLSIDSIDASPNLESHRRSKSILKNKSETSKVLDPESERLLADNMSGAGISDISVNNFLLSFYFFNSMIVILVYEDNNDLHVSTAVIFSS